MKIFVLEDNVQRIKQFATRLLNHSVVITTNAEEAIKELSKNLDYDYFFLDHDLGDEVFMDSNLPNTGYQVAKFLADKEIKGRIVIHSMNYDGAKNMQSLLPKAKTIMFNPLMFEGFGL